MKKQLLFVCLFLFCAVGKAQITIHTAQIEAFHSLMQYIEQKAGGTLSCECSEGVDLQAVFERNRKDSTLNTLIENLLNSSVFYSPNHIRNVRVRLDHDDNAEATAHGREAYKIALTILPDFCVFITGGISFNLVDFWNHEHRARVDKAIVELKANQKEIAENVKQSLKVLLPNDIDMDTKINIHIIVDGNRDSHVFDNNIMMEMVWQLLHTGFENLSQFINVLKHEMHHVFYIPWLAEKTARDRNAGERFLFSYQRGFIIEGIAQRFNYDDKSPEVKQVFANRELIAELFDEWISLMRGMVGESPQVAFQAYRESFETPARDRMRRFWSGNMDSIEWGYRPTVTYTLSFNVYNLIYESGGHEKLKFVIENPAKLLSVFNELHTECMIVPRVPDDIVMLWKNNLTP